MVWKRDLENTRTDQCLAEKMPEKNVGWPNKISDKNIIEQIRQERATWFPTGSETRLIDNVLRMENTAMTWQPEGRRKRGLPKTT